jgi:hypothetical protein
MLRGAALGLSWLVLSCGGRAQSDTTPGDTAPGDTTPGTCSGCPLPRLSSSQAIAAMRKKLPSDARLVMARASPAGSLSADGTDVDWVLYFISDSTLQAWDGRAFTLSGTLELTLEANTYYACDGPDLNDIPSTELVPQALRQIDALSLAPAQYTLPYYWEMAPCRVADQSSSNGAFLTGHTVQVRRRMQPQPDQYLWSYFDDDGKPLELCGPCVTSSLAPDCTQCTPESGP